MCWSISSSSPSTPANRPKVAALNLMPPDGDMFTKWVEELMAACHTQPTDRDKIIKIGEGSAAHGEHDPGDEGRGGYRVHGESPNKLSAAPARSRQLASSDGEDSPHSGSAQSYTATPPGQAPFVSPFAASPGPGHETHRAPSQYGRALVNEYNASREGLRVSQRQPHFAPTARRGAQCAGPLALPKRATWPLLRARFEEHLEHRHRGSPRAAREATPGLALPSKRAWRRRSVRALRATTPSGRELARHSLRVWHAVFRTSCSQDTQSRALGTVRLVLFQERAAVRISRRASLFGSRVGRAFYP